MLESRFKEILKHGFKEAYPNCLFDKIVQDGRTGAGRPDLLVIGSTRPRAPGYTVYIETKVKKNKPSSVQMYRMWDICSSGGTAVWARGDDSGMSHYYTIDGDEFLIKNAKDCKGVLEACVRTVNRKRREGVLENLQDLVTSLGVKK